jgi:hypothetical protein
LQAFIKRFDEIILVNNSGNSAQQWPEQIRVLLVAIPNYNQQKGDSK